MSLTSLTKEKCFRMRIKYKLMISYLILIIFAVSVLGSLIAQKSNKAILNEVNEKSQRLTESIITTLSVRNDLLTEKSYGDLNFANTLLNDLADINVKYNENIQIGEFNLPVLYAGSQRLSLDNTVVDKLKQSTGTAATIFLLHDNKLIRVSSTIFKGNNRVVGTYITSDSTSYKKIISSVLCSVNYPQKVLASSVCQLLHTQKMLTLALRTTTFFIPQGRTNFVLLSDP